RPPPCRLVRAGPGADYHLRLAHVRIGHSRFRSIGGSAMRVEKAAKLLRLAMELQARRQGMSGEEIQAEFAVSRSTALRMKAALEAVFPVEEAPQQEDRRKRWRIPTGTLNKLAACTADELADLEMAVD